MPIMLLVNAIFWIVNGQHNKIKKSYKYSIVRIESPIIEKLKKYLHPNWTNNKTATLGL